MRHCISILGFARRSVCPSIFSTHQNGSKMLGFQPESVHRVWNQILGKQALTSAEISSSIKKPTLPHLCLHKLVNHKNVAPWVTILVCWSSTELTNFAIWLSQSWRGSVMMQQAKNVMNTALLLQCGKFLTFLFSFAGYDAYWNSIWEHAIRIQELDSKLLLE